MFTTCLCVSFINGLYSAVITLADVFSPADQLSLPARYVRQPGQRSTLQVWHRRFSWNISGIVVTTFVGAVWKGHSWDFPSGYHGFVSRLVVVLFLIDHHTVPYLTNVYGFLTLTMLFFPPKRQLDHMTMWHLTWGGNTKCIHPSSCLSYRLFVTSPPEKQLLEAIVWSNLGGWPSSLFFLFRSFYQHPKCWTDANGEINRLFQSHSQQSFSIRRTKRSGTRQSPQLLITEKQKSASSEESHSSSVQWKTKLKKPTSESGTEEVRDN